MKTNAAMNNFLEQEEDQAIEDLYLIFHLDEEDYGIGIGNVTEIVGKQAITKVPSLPPYVRGVINLRGQVIPVIDVRTRFGLPFREYDDRTCAIVINVNQVQFGLLVDVVDEVISIDPAKISPPPTMSGQSRFIKGMGRTDNTSKVKILLDVSLLFGDSDLEHIAALSKA